MIGATVGNFRILSPLGKGGMGEVFLAEQVSVKTRVAIKVLQPQISEDKAQVQRFFNEAIAASKINHPGVVRIFDVGFTEGGRAYLVMELLEGESLAARIQRGRMAIGEVCRIGRQLANLLDTIHQAGITHRDLKPDNIFIVPDPEIGTRVKLLDFGIAKLSGTLGGMTSTSAGAMGTPHYMAPEQWMNAKLVDWRTDAYSLGCVLYEMTAGGPPFEAETIGEACAKHLGIPPPPVRERVPTAPPAFEQLVLQLLAKKPEQRPATMRAVVDALDAIAPAKQVDTLATTIPASAAPTIDTLGGIPIRPTTPGARKRWPVVAIGAAVVAIAAIVVVVSMTGSSTPRTIDAGAIAVGTPIASPPDAASVTVVVADAAIPVDAAAIDARPVDAAIAVAKPPLQASSGGGTTTTDSACDEVGCLLAEHPGPCCARFKKPIKQQPPPETPPPDPPPPELPADLDRTMIQTGVGPVKASVIDCANGTTGLVKLAVKVAPDGRVSDVTVKATPNDSLGECVAKKMRAARFAKTRNGGTFSYPFVFQ